MAETRSKALDILRTLQADNMLEGFKILSSLQSIRGSMTYRDRPFVDVFEEIQGAIEQIGWLQLRSDVDVLSASGYLVELATNYERILMGINRQTIASQTLLGRCKTIYAKATTLKLPFLVTWSLGATDLIEGSALKKLCATDMKALAAEQFTYLLDEADQELGAMIEALDMTLDNLKVMRKNAADTYAIGKDQVNAALSEMDLPDHGLGEPEHTKKLQAVKGISVLKNLFPGRVSDKVEPATGPGTPETEDELPAELMGSVVDLDAAALELPVPEPAPVVGAPKPKSHKPEAHIFTTNVNLQSPGFTQADGIILRKRTSKVTLTAQDNPAENGVWVFQGFNAPLTRMEAMPGTSAVVEVPPVEVAPVSQEPMGVETIVPVQPVEFTLAVPTQTLMFQEGDILIPSEVLKESRLDIMKEKMEDAVQAINADPFISPSTKTEILAKLPTPVAEDDDFPTDPDIQVIAPKGLELEDDFPGEGVQLTIPMGDDLPGEPAPVLEEDDFPMGAEPVDATPATQELGTPAETITPQPETIAPKVETAAPKAAKPTSTPETTEPRASGGLFRRRSGVLPPNLSAVPPFKPTVVLPASEGADEFM